MEIICTSVLCSPAFWASRLLLALRKMWAIVGMGVTYGRYGWRMADIGVIWGKR